MKRIKSPLSRLLSLLYNNSIDEGHFPDILKYAFIIGIFKSGDKTDPGNYRPISLTSHLSKAMEQVMRKEIVKHLDDNNLLDND